jgi:glycosyltransferase involved in cell wall biosynthesis
MKVLFISNVFCGTGWSYAGRAWCEALDAAGVDVVLRPIIMSGGREPLSERLQALLDKSSSGCDVVIQHCLPHLCSYNGHFARNICLFVNETSNFRQSNWADHLNLMDEVWVASRHQIRACQESGVVAPLKVVPHALDVERFQRSYPVLPSLKALKEDGVFLFYAVGEFVERKGWRTLLRAYLSEFDVSEPVRLVVKTSSPGVSPEVLSGKVNEFVAETAKSLKIGATPEVVVLTERLSHEGLMSLHATADCFVLPSFCEAFCLPAAEAMAMGKTPIVPASSGFLDWADDEIGWTIPTREEPCQGVYSTFEDLYTGRENWWVPDILALKRAMREAYENPLTRQRKALRGIERSYDFSHEAVGPLLKQALHERVEDLAAVPG